MTSREKGAVLKLLTAGEHLSNIAYNLKQLPELAKHAASMSDAVSRWDASVGFYSSVTNPNYGKADSKQSATEDV